MKYNEVIKLTNEILEQYDRATIRQIYYRLVSPPYQYMENTNSMYNSYDKMTVKARECGDMDWQRIVDGTRFTIEPPSTYESVEGFMAAVDNTVRNFHTHYHVDYWAEQPIVVRLFIEKQALAQVVNEVASGYQVPVTPGRGYNSFTQLKELAVKLEQDTAINGKPIKVLYFGDFDPSGIDIDKSLTKRLQSYCKADITVIRCALTEDDVTHLPSSPVPKKKLGDSRLPSYYAKYGDNVWELDALPPTDLKSRVTQTISAEIHDGKSWAIAKKIEVENHAIVEQKIKELWRGESAK